MSAMSNLEPQEALVRKFFERRNVQLFEGVTLRVLAEAIAGVPRVRSLIPDVEVRL